MKLKFIILFLLLVNAIFSAIKDPKADSLQTQLQIVTDDNVRFSLLESLFQIEVEKDTKKAESCLKEMIALDKKINSPVTNIKLAYVLATNALSQNSNDRGYAVVAVLQQTRCHKTATTA